MPRHMVLYNQLVDVSFQSLQDRMRYVASDMQFDLMFNKIIILVSSSSITIEGMCRGSGIKRRVYKSEPA